MTKYEPTDPTSVWFLDVHPGICEWRVSAIRACIQSIQEGYLGLEAWLTAVDHCVQCRTGTGLEQVAKLWRQKALERCRPAYEAGNCEAAATELVYYIEEVVCIHRHRLQRY